jgi:hypothetical protein
VVSDALAAKEILKTKVRGRCLCERVSQTRSHVTEQTARHSLRRVDRVHGRMARAGRLNA